MTCMQVPTIPSFQSNGRQVREGGRERKAERERQKEKGTEIEAERFRHKARHREWHREKGTENERHRQQKGRLRRNLEDVS